MKFLMIQNGGICPIEGFTVMGLSSSRGREDTVGNFGSGNKHASLLLLRKGINPVIFCGLARIEFETEDATFDTGISRQEYKRVSARLSGKVDGKQAKRKVDLNWTTDYGATDWTDISMAMREFISNAIDRCVVEFGTFDHPSLRIEVVQESQVRAADGFTRIFVPLTDEVEDYYVKLPQKFLQFSTDVSPGETMFSNATPSPCKIYKKGVFVREIGEKSIFNYNMDNLKLDECRNANDSICRSEVSHVIRDLPKRKLSQLMREVQEISDDYVERSLDSYELRPSSISYSELPRREDTKKRWREAFELAYGEDAVLCPPDERFRDLIRRKGKTPVSMPSCWERAIADSGAPTHNSVLDELEQKGRVVSDAPNACLRMLTQVWETIELAGMTKEKSRPAIKTFSEVNTDAGCQTLGFYRDSTVFIREDIASAESAMLYRVVLEECVHHCTGASDMSRDLQDYAFQMITNYCYRPTRNQDDN